jgi:hypothetical protein
MPTLDVAERKIEIASEFLANVRPAWDVAEELPNIGFPVLCAFMDMESEGKNSYGGDEGGALEDYPGRVTEDNYQVFWWLVESNGYKSNGAGPMQITYWPYHIQAREEGLKLWVPRDNIFFGARICAGNIANRRKAGSEGTRLLQEIGTLYNHGSLRDGINDYGREFANLAYDWRDRLSL